MRRPFDERTLGDDLRRAALHGAGLGRQLRTRQAIMGIFDEGCMGMYNAIIPDHLLHAAGIFKERLSQSALYAAMRRGAATRRRRATTRGCVSAA